MGRKLQRFRKIART